MKIRARISAKLKDQSGASITYALLLFLVCAVVSSVVLAAGTAAAGRMSKAVETDQRYYAVTSAARVLKEQLDGKTNTIELDELDGEKHYRSGLPETYGITDYASAVVIGQASQSPIDLDFSVAGDDLIIVKETVDRSKGKLYLDVSNKDTDSGVYSIRLTFSADIEDVVSKRKNKSGETVITNIKEKITWHYDGMETGVALNSGD